MGGMSSSAFWILIQRELGCNGCRKFNKEMEGVGVPCDRYTQIENDGDSMCVEREEER